jgi:hypothetical protein
MMAMKALPRAAESADGDGFALQVADGADPVGPEQLQAPDMPSR